MDTAKVIRELRKKEPGCRGESFLSIPVFLCVHWRTGRQPDVLHRVYSETDRLSVKIRGVARRKERYCCFL